MGLSPQMRTPSTHTSMMCNQSSLTSQGHVSSQPSLTSQSGHGVKNINMSGSGGVQTSLSGPVSLSGPGSLGVNSGVSVSSPSMSTTTTNTLPSFKDSMKLNVLGTVTSSFQDGSLPSITSATSSFHTIHNNDDYLRETVINDILEVCLLSLFYIILFIFYFIFADPLAHLKVAVTVSYERCMLGILQLPT